MIGARNYLKFAHFFPDEKSRDSYLYISNNDWLLTFSDQNSCGYLLEARHRALLILLVSIFILFSLFLSLYFLRHFHSVFHCAFLVGFPIDFHLVFFCISTAYLIVYFYLQFQLYLIAYFSQVKLGSDSTHLKVFLQTHSGKLETATYLVRASPSNLKLELNSDLNLNLNLISNFESGGPPSPSLIQPQDYKRGLLIIWKANKI